MKVTDIVNRDIVNLDNCESEPIHIPGSIQPHGFLLGLNAVSLHITYCSENVHQFTGMHLTDLLGRPANILLPDAFIRSVPMTSDAEAMGPDMPYTVALGQARYTAFIHHSDDTIVIELEAESTAATDSHALFQQTRHFIHHIESSVDLRALCQYVVDEIRRITGYDRVMVYRFDEQYNGEVFAESRHNRIEPFLGLHYPHTDIPVQARALYIKNLLRVIVDVNYVPVPVYTISDGEPKGLDMSHAILRSVSPIHIQYLQNMGVGATLTVSLVQDGKLWGLIACHHYSPKYLDHNTKVRVKLQGHFLASQIRVRESNEEYTVARAVDLGVQMLVTRFIQLKRESLPDLVKQNEMLSICNATGVAMRIDGQVYAAGKVPRIKALHSLIDHLADISRFTSLYTDHLLDIYPDAKDYIDVAAGIIYFSLGGKSNGIAWLRHETTKEVKWAGDPSKAILKDEKGLHPRKSFNAWKHIVQGKSQPWLKPEITAAENFTHFLQRQVHLMFITEEEAKYRELSLKLQEANAELENINWISAHDLKEPLRKIQVFASRVLDTEEPLPPQVLHDVTRMKVAAERMQVLIYDILTYSRVSKVADAMSNVGLTAVVADAIHDLQEEIEESHAVITCDELPEVRGVRFLLSQVFLNLFRNALKFTRDGVNPVISVEYDGQPVTHAHPILPFDKPFHVIRVVDNGIGFDDEHKDNIFDVFTRLHSRDKYGGSGVGLATCKKIMQNHGGNITANGVPGEGSVFTLYFPAGKN